MRPSKRAADEMRKVTLERGVVRYAEGSCMVTFGETKVLCAATVEEKGPPWLRGTGKGWVTAEYSMLPRATHERTRREVTSGKPSGRTQEIQRLVGRSLRAVVDLTAIGERQMIALVLDESGKEAAALLFIHQPIEQNAAERGGAGEDSGDVDVTGGKLLGDDAAGQGVGAGAAGVFRQRQGSEAELGSRVDEVDRERGIERFEPLGLGGERKDILGDEVAKGAEGLQNQPAV